MFRRVVRLSVAARTLSRLLRPVSPVSSTIGAAAALHIHEHRNVYLRLFSRWFLAIILFYKRLLLSRITGKPTSLIELAAGVGGGQRSQLHVQQAAIKLSLLAILYSLD
jgi:hypothetical protein